MNTITSLRDEAVPTAPFKIVILYQNLTAGIRAREMAERLGKQVNSQGELNVVLWKFDVLEYPSMQELAAQDAASADMLIVSAGVDKLPPVSVRDWLEEVFPTARSAEARCALVALLGRGEQNRVIWGTQNEACEYLEQVAAKLGMDFFCKFDADASAHNSAQRKQELVVNNLLFLDESFTPDVNWQRWGINE